MLAVFGEGHSTRVPATDPSHCELIYSEFSSAFEQPGTPLKKNIKDEIDLLPYSVPPADM